jgi:hypothetical protein
MAPGERPDPKGAFTLVKEDMQATSQKFDVEDKHGVHCRVKLGEEPESETAATRFLWAAGYFVDEDYYTAQSSVLPAGHQRSQLSRPHADGTGHDTVLGLTRKMTGAQAVHAVRETNPRRPILIDRRVFVYALVQCHASVDRFGREQSAAFVNV